MIVASAQVILWGCSPDTPAVAGDAAARSSPYLYVWAGADAEEESDFLAVIDVDTASPRYGDIMQAFRLV